MTQGRLSLLAVLQRTTAREVAARCQVSPTRVSEWASGLCLPALASRERLARIYGIRVEAWRVAPVASFGRLR